MSTPATYVGAVMLAMSPRATMTLQMLPKLPRVEYPATIRAHCEVSRAENQALSVVTPVASPIPSINANVKLRDRPIIVKQKTLAFEVSRDNKRRNPMRRQRT